MAGEESQSLLLALPDPCLLAVLQCCAADDQHSVVSAARAHPRLHQAAVLALRTIRAVVPEQQKVDSVVAYLARHGNHIDSIDLTGASSAVLQELPPDLQLSSLWLEKLGLYLQQGNGQGVPGAAAASTALKQLRLSSCELLGSYVAGAEVALATALSLLPAGLQQLSICNLARSDQFVHIPTTVLQRLQQLTCFELVGNWPKGPNQAGPALQPLQALTRLAHLRLEGQPFRLEPVAASMLSGTHHLTHLDLSGNSVEPGVVAGKTQLQHLRLVACYVPGGQAGLAQLLSKLQPLQQLTRLDLAGSLAGLRDEFPPAAAYSALTASSKLQHLNISRCKLPAGVWQHLFPAGRQLLQLTSLNILAVQQPQDLAGCFASATAGSHLVSCCPSLGSLEIRWLQCSPEILPALKGLSKLHTLGVGAIHFTAEHLLHLTQLKQLRALQFVGIPYLDLTCRAPGDEPVWRQLAQQFLKHSNPDVAQEAAAALAH